MSETTQAIIIADLILVGISLGLTGLGIVFALWRKRRAPKMPAFMPPPNLCRHCMKCHAYLGGEGERCIALQYCASCKPGLHPQTDNRGEMNHG